MKKNKKKNEKKAQLIRSGVNAPHCPLEHNPDLSGRASLPRVAIVMSCAQAHDDDVTLHHDDVETLFHEYGHALAGSLLCLDDLNLLYFWCACVVCCYCCCLLFLFLSLFLLFVKVFLFVWLGLLSRTQFQHVAGTRVALDFAEVPSTLLERYVWEHDVLR